MEVRTICLYKSFIILFFHVCLHLFFYVMIAPASYLYVILLCAFYVFVTYCFLGYYVHHFIVPSCLIVFIYCFHVCLLFSFVVTVPFLLLSYLYDYCWFFFTTLCNLDCICTCILNEIVPPYFIYLLLSLCVIFLVFYLDSCMFRLFVRFPCLRKTSCRTRTL